MAVKPLIAVTMGDPTGIGPEIIAKALGGDDLARTCRMVVLGDRDVMERGIAVSGLPLTIEITPDGAVPEEPRRDVIYLQPLVSLAADACVYGRPTAASGDAMYRCITEAARLCLAGRASAMATAPINKEAMNRAGHAYPGHTELLAELTGTDDFVMMLAGEKLRVTLVTIHEPLAKVPELITREQVLTTIRITARDVGRYFVRKPRLAVLALNPHGGEGGMFGREEQDSIAPAVTVARGEGIDVVGPLPADTLFHFAVNGAYDAVVCMYHDQGLIPLKLLHFYDGVNVTLGLPIIRTSVDHGTAYDLAGTGTASELSMAAAIRMAAEMANVRDRGLGTGDLGKPW